MSGDSSFGLSLAVAAGSNLDNLGAGLSYGIGRRCLGGLENGLVAVLALASTAGSMALGAAGDRWIPASLAARGGGLLVVAVGLVMAVRALGRSRGLAGAVSPGRPGTRSGPGIAKVDAGSAVSWREALVVGLGLSLNNLAAGLGAGASGLSLPVTSALSGALSFACLDLGGRVGAASARRMLGRAGSLAAAVLLVAVGVRMCAV